MRRSFLCGVLLVALELTCPSTVQAAAHRPAAAPSPHTRAGPTTLRCDPLSLLGPPSTAHDEPTRAEAVTTQHIIYGYDQGLVLDADLTVPVGATAPLPAVLVVHGGAWSHGNLSLMAASALAIAQSGFVTLNIDYRLDSRLDPGFPGQVDDLRQAVGYLRSNAGALGVDPQRIGALGTSAGGNLALLLATDSQGECTAGDRVSSVVTWSAPDDLATYGRANQRYCTDGRSGCPMLFRSAEQYLGCAYAACPGRWEQASVPGYVDGNDPPTLLFNGSDELVPLSQARDLASTLIAHGDAAQLVVVPGRRHAIAYAADALAPTIAFFQHYLG